MYQYSSKCTVGISTLLGWQNKENLCNWHSDDFSNSNAAKCNERNIICLYFTSLLKRSKKNAVWAEKKVLFGKPRVFSRNTVILFYLKVEEEILIVSFNTFPFIGAFTILYE